MARIREIRPCRAWAPGQHIPLGWLCQEVDPWLPWEAGPQGNGLSSLPLPEALLPAPLCRAHREQMLLRARSWGRHWQETQEQLQCCKTCCSGGWLEPTELAWPSP